MFLVIWKFEINEKLQKEFEELYGQNGKWVKLFKNDNSYIKTELIKDISQPNIYVTIDHWKSKSIYEKFLKESKVQFEIIDQEGEGLTKSEIKIGWFETLENI
ncbi:MAG: hypothetical protein UR31_C0015G0009 [Parcubacteria group bacterium GW2011_GWA2_33_14]|uniref:ABM domain-containing protein n=1 Tax=Candidatus Staskawiczbacteria bacterium RIFCSPHIGHO2_02_FULL_33_16 TaxID=1802204 RepID=A0A1G2HXC1_9BACT|nr:MAG: hypothetical protein UR31_C0015G0009 [Parcubacteria group bacterium GW2011_GWA2_33_14]OGZ67117.1 MAG: hypothetical protein A3D34_02480 [Candidatus Staskawiczbacteria bacterium RIFCSPHIGHO2_02_FULL_33_16]OGZ70953.1 MAG: hypothetical protein A2980_03010 [Candidatus Staskawiczbacteria bacterium RIFCSPLOWO2_01_FULL_33_13]